MGQEVATLLVSAKGIQIAHTATQAKVRRWLISNYPSQTLKIILTSGTVCPCKSGEQCLWYAKNVAGLDTNPMVLGGKIWLSLDTDSHKGVITLTMETSTAILSSHRPTPQNLLESL